MKLLLVILVLRYIKKQCIGKVWILTSIGWASPVQDQTDLPNLVTCACKISSFHCFQMTETETEFHSDSVSLPSTSHIYRLSFSRTEQISQILWHVLHCLQNFKFSDDSFAWGWDSDRLSEFHFRLEPLNVPHQYFFIIYQPTGLQWLPNITHSLRNFANISTQSVWTRCLFASIPGRIKILHLFRHFSKTWASWDKSFPQVNAAVRQSSYQTLQCWSITHVVTLGCLLFKISVWGSLCIFCIFLQILSDERHLQEWKNF